MNNDLKYALQGVLLVVGFLISWGIVRYIFSVKLSNDTPTGIISNLKNFSVTNSEGKQLFQENCASCHSIDKIIVGPALRGIEERITDKQLLYEWIQNNQKVLKSGEPYFVTLYNEYNKTLMPLFPSLKNDDIDSILVYIKNSSDPMPQPVAAVYDKKVLNVQVPTRLNTIRTGVT